MAESLGEVFVEVLGDTSPFADSLEDGIGGALADVKDNIADSLSGIEGIGQEAFGGVAAAASDAGEDIAEAFEEGADEAQQALEGITLEGVAEQLKENMLGITLAFGGIGAGTEAFARKQQETNRILGRVGDISGIATDELRDMIGAMTDHTFSAEDAARSMERLIQSGVTTQEEFEQILPLMDNFSDATGIDMVKAIDDFDRVLSALGTPMTEVGDHLDTMGFLQARTTASMRDLGMLMRREAQPIRDMGLSMDDVAVAMAALEAEGRRGPRAVMGFQDALKEADGDIEKFWAGLQVSNDTLETQRESLADSAGMIDRFAEINNDAMTPTERLQANLGNLAFRFGGVAEVAGIVAAPIAGIGPVMMSVNATSQVLGGALPKLGKALAGAGKAFLALGKVILANPLFLIGALLIGLAVLIWKFRDDIVEALVGAWDWIKEVTGKFWDWLKGLVETLVETVTGFFTNMAEKVKDIFTAWWNWYRGLWERLFGFVRDIVNRIRDFVVNGFNTLRERASNAVQSLRDSVRNGLNSIVDFVRDLPGRIVRGLGNLGGLLVDKGREMIQGFLDGATDLLSRIGSFLLDRIPGWIRTPFEKALGISSPSRVFAELGRDTIAGYAMGVQEEVGNLERMMGNLAADIPMTVQPTVDGIGGIASGGVVGGRGVEVNMVVNNPEPEPASASATREIRKLAAIGVFGD